MIKELEKLLEVFRYAYYVKAHSIISDRTYDELEKLSSVSKVGSDKEDDYTKEIKQLYQNFIND